MRLRIAVALGAAGLLAAAAPASAAVSASTITVPGSPSFLISDAVMPNTITVSGTTNGSPGDPIDINCYRGSGSSRTLVSGLAVQAGGSFTFTGSFSAIAGGTCVLRAVTAGDTTAHPPGSPSPFQGPTLALGVRAETKLTSGPNSGTLQYYSIYGSQLLGAYDYYSLGNCSVADSYTYDATTFASVPLDYCNAWFDWRNGSSSPGFAAPTRSELQVDGADAFLPGNIGGINGFTAANNSGFPSLTYGYAIDPATGNLVINETDQVVKCSPGGAYPPTTSNCASFVPVGVQVQMRIAQGQGGRVATVTQWLSSTDGRPHAVDLLENNEFGHPSGDGRLSFPWTGAGFVPYATPGQVIPGPGGAPGSFFIKGSAMVPDGGEARAQGAVTFSNAPDSATVIGTTTNSSHSWIDLGYRRTVPATGSLPLGFTYSNAFLASEVNADAATAEAAYRPVVAISAPATGATTAQSQVTVSGTASDATGLTSLTVNGQSVPVAANGTWSANMPLSAGANTITAKATNVFGNSSQAQAAVTYVPVAPASKLSIVGKPKLGATGASLSLACQAPAGQTCIGTAMLTTTEKIQLPGNKVVALSARTRHKRIRSRTVIVGAVRFTVAAGQSKSVSVPLNATGKKLLVKFGRLPVTLAVTFTAANGQSSTVVHTKSTIKRSKKHTKRH